MSLKRQLSEAAKNYKLQVAQIRSDWGDGKEGLSKVRASLAAYEAHLASVAMKPVANLSPHGEAQPTRFVDSLPQCGADCCVVLTAVWC